ncbi:uncharacterized protein LOC116618667 [Nematostella vectensis]|uniref:uncharacterized protein LOC116618667 n=1 Tax=Nematostella vectensis TaxID=45351 RepID=UPI00138FF933|nr:uncharacterized protein LOC116618667 [Nematostella vectensis]
MKPDGPLADPDSSELAPGIVWPGRQGTLGFIFVVVLVVLLVITYDVGGTWTTNRTENMVDIDSQTLIQNMNIPHETKKAKPGLAHHRRQHQKRKRKSKQKSSNEMKVKQLLKKKTKIPYPFRVHPPNQFRETCGSGWYEKYARLHRDMLTGRRKPLYLAYSCPGTRWGCCGYGNRMRAIVSLFYLAVLTDRAFLIDWLIPEPISNHLEPNRIQWNRSDILDVCTGMESRRHYWGTARAELREAEGYIIHGSAHFKDWFSSTDFKRYFDWPVEVATTIWYFAEGGITDNRHLMRRAHELNVKPLISRAPKYALIGCAFHFLFSVSSTVQSYLDVWMHDLRGTPTIGLHIRTGDDQFDYFSSVNDRSFNLHNRTRLKGFFECAKKAEKTFFKNANGRIRWFLATDHVKVKRFAKKHYPDKIITTNLTIQHLDILYNSSGLNYTIECNYTTGLNGSAYCYQLTPFNKTAYCANRENNTALNNTVSVTEGIIAMLVDHFLLAQCDFLILSDSSFGSSAVGLSMRTTGEFVFGDVACSDLNKISKPRKLTFFKKRSISKDEEE